MKIISSLLTIFLLLSCASDQFTKSQYEKYPVKFAKQKITYPNNTFELFIPRNWEWKVENYDDIKEFNFGIDAFSKPDEKNFIYGISIQNTNSFSTSKTLKEEYAFLLEKLTSNPNLKLIESGKTNFYENETYYIHGKSNSGIYGEIEMISFITKSKEGNTFYYLNASASQTKELKMKMAIMLQCLKTFKEN